MAKDYFQDVVPPEGDEARTPHGAAPAQQQSAPTSSDRSIRNVNIPQRPRPFSDSRPLESSSSFSTPRRRSGGSRWWLWAIAFVALVIIALILIIFVFRQTTVTVTPQSQPVVFDQGSQFTAYPVSTAVPGTLTYTTDVTDIAASSPVTASGTEHADVKAAGSITVVNDYSAKPLTLIKNTRFETPDGLIFRTPSAIVVPGKSGSQAGMAVTNVVADQPGAQYNVGPIGRFTVPGLQSTPDMYSNVYAYSNASTTGGFSGDRPAVDSATASTTIATLQTQLAEEAQTFAQAQASSSSVAFAGLEQVTYQEMPETVASDGSVSINETAHVVLPIFPADQFASAIAQTVSADASGASVQIIPGQGFAATPSNPNEQLGVSAMTFSLAGQAEIVWNVDTNALAQALAGHDQAAFQGITSNFPGIREAHARIEPFWESSFPSNPSDIHITVLPPMSANPVTPNVQ